MRELYQVLMPYMTAISGVTCIVPAQNVKTPPPPFATVEIQSTQATGSFFTARDNSDNIETAQRTFAFTVDVNIYGRNGKPLEAMDIGQTILDNLVNHRRRVLAMNGLMAFQSVISDPQDVTDLIADQHQPRVNLAMRWHTARAITYSIDMIDTLEINDNDPFQDALTT